MKMGVLGHHLGISWHGINLFPPQCCSVTKSSPTLDPMDTAAQQVSLSFTVPQGLLKHMFIESVIPSNHLTLSCLLPLLPSIFPSIMVFFSGLALRLGGQSIEASNIPMNIQDWFPLGLPGLIALQFKGLSRVFSNTTVQKYQFFIAQLSLWSNSHFHTWLLEKP